MFCKMNLCCEFVNVDRVQRILCVTGMSLLVCIPFIYLSGPLMLLIAACKQVCL